MARGKYVWLNGDIRPAEDCKISLFTHALHYGVGAFEGIRAYKQSSGGGAIFRLEEHMERLVESWNIVGLPFEYSAKQLSQAAIDITKKNEFEECYIRPIVFVGDGPLGVDPGENPPVQTAILNWEWGKYLGDEGVTKGVRLKISSYQRPHVNSVMTKGKITGQYVTGVMAKREAVSHGYNEAILLDTDGYVSEGSGENIFMLKHGVIKTTPLTSVLGGITRRTIIEHLRQQGHTVEEQRFTRDTLYGAEEAFMCGTAAEVTPIREIDNRKIGEGKPGPITMKLQKEYLAMVRGDVPSYGANWLTKIQ